MSASLNVERMWLYAAAEPLDAEGNPSPLAYSLLPAPTVDQAWPCAAAPQKGREDQIAMRRTTILRIVFTVADEVPVPTSGLVRWQRTGVLYRVEAVDPITATRELLVRAESVERGQYPITADVPEWTAAYVIVNPPSIAISPGTTRILRATVTNAASVVLQERPVTWRSDDYAVCTIDAQGKAVGTAAGQTTITATAGDVSGTCGVTVFG